MRQDMIPLKKSDRCDRCNAEAKARVELKAGDLLFCGHHLNEHMDKLMELGVGISTRKEHEMDLEEVK